MTRSEAIRIISKALKRADKEEIGRAYMHFVDCGLCPVEEECNKGYILCCHFIAEKISEEEQDAQESK